MSTTVTVTVNPAVDQTLWVPGFAVGAVNRVEREHTRPGGKGVNVAARLAELGIDVAATGVLGAENASSFETLMADRGIVDAFVRRSGATRTGIKVVDTIADGTTDINFPGAAIDAATLTALEDRVSELAGAAAWVVFAGSLPPDAPADLYRRLIDVAHERGASVALDTSGAALAASIDARPDLVKPNGDELAQLVGRALDGVDDVVKAAEELTDAGIGTVVVSLGADGALFLDGTDVVHAGPLPVAVASTVGAGDAMVAGIVAGRLRHRPLAELAAFATACSATAIAAVESRLIRSETEALAASVRITFLKPTSSSHETRGKS